MAEHLPHNHGGCFELNLQEVPNTDAFSQVADLFKLLDDSKRLRIFWLLCHGEECVINISAMMEMSSPAVSHHLKALKSGGLIISRREGKEVYYTAAATDQVRALHETIENIMKIRCLCPLEHHEHGEKE